MSQARGDSLLKLTENREALIHRASDQAEFARKVELGQFCITDETAMYGHRSTVLCREYIGHRNQHLGCLEIHDYKHFSPIMSRLDQ